MPSSTLCQQERPTDLLRPSSCPCNLPGDTMLLEPAGHPLGILVGVMARPAARPAQHYSMSRAGDTDGPGTHPCWASSRIPTGSEHAGSTLGLYQQPSFSADTVPRGREQAQVQSQGWGYPLPAPARGPQPSCAPSRDPPFLLPHPCSGWMYSWWPHPHCHPEPPGGRVTGRDCGDSCDSNNRTQRTGRAGTQGPGRTTWAAQPWAAPGSPKPVPPMEASSLHQPRHAHLPGLQSEPQAQLCVVNGGIAPQLFQGQSEVGQGFLEPVAAGEPRASAAAEKGAQPCCSLPPSPTPSSRDTCWGQGWSPRSQPTVGTQVPTTGQGFSTQPCSDPALNPGHLLPCLGPLSAPQTQLGGTSRDPHPQGGFCR